MNELSDEAGDGQNRPSGAISITVHTHSSAFRGPRDAPTLAAETVPLRHPITQQRFSYSSVACGDPAPYNDVGLNFDPEYPGVENPAAVRHIIEGEVTDVQDSAGTAHLRGTLTTYLCEDGEKGDRLDSTFEGELEQQPDVAGFTGRFEITGGTGRFAGIQGAGSMHGHLTCLDRVLERERADSCAELGRYTDAVFFRSDERNPVPDEVTGGLEGRYMT